MLPIVVFVIPFLFVSFISWFYQKFFATKFDVKDKIVLITGASSGLGAACAHRFTMEGAKVVLCARNVTALNAVKKKISGYETSEWPIVCPMDVTKSEEITNCVKQVEEKHGPVDVLISNAGVSQRGSVKDTVIDVHLNLMNINYFGPVNLVKAILPSMIQRKQGHIISIGSVQGQVAIPFRSAYAASKHAGQAFFDSLRAEVAEDHINVTVVNPGYIRTNLSRNALSGDGSKHGILDATTATGMHPSFVANHILLSITLPVSEVTLADLKSNVAMYLRTLAPPLFFKVMEWRAKSEMKKMKKSS